MNLELLSKVEELLNQSNDLSELKVQESKNAISISVGTDYEIEDELSEYPLKAGCYDEEIIEEHVIEDFCEYKESQDKTENVLESGWPQDERDGKDNQTESNRQSKQKTSRKYRYPSNTNDKLSNEEKEWINTQVRKYEVVQNGQVFYKCPLCGTILQIPGSFKKHLRDSHILKSESERDAWNSRRAFKEEIKRSKLTIETEFGLETIWKCPRCDTNRIFKSEAGLKVHIRYNHIRNQVIDAKFIAQYKTVVDEKEVWKCPECNKILRSRDGLRNHLKLEHSEVVCANEKEFFASEVVFSDNDSLISLLDKKRRRVKPEVISSSCSECGVDFINGSSKKEKSARIHKECHKILEVVSLYYQLPKCDIYRTMFSNDDDLNTFLQSDQEYFEPLPCDGMIAKVSRKVKESTGTASANESDAWSCGHCGTSYQTEVECISHVMILHSKKLICPIDHMEFEGNRGMSLFTIHMRNKHSEMFPDLVISCTYCQMEFSSIFDKLAHMKICDEKKFECDHCSKKYFTKTDLSRHLKIVSGEISFKCEICNKSCSTTMELKLHRTTHTNQKFYACSYPHCSKAFKTPTARSSHMETHGNISYSCSFCTSSFRQRALLQRHVRKGFCQRPLKERAKNQATSQIAYEESHIF